MKIQHMQIRSASNLHPDCIAELIFIEFNNDHILNLQFAPIREISIRNCDYSKTGQSIIGVNIQGTNMGTVTDMDGKFSLQVSDLNSKLVFSYMCYSKQVIKRRKMLPDLLHRASAKTDLGSDQSEQFFEIESGNSITNFKVYKH